MPPPGSDDRRQGRPVESGCWGQTSLESVRRCPERTAHRPRRAACASGRSAESLHGLLRCGPQPRLPYRASVRRPEGGVRTADTGRPAHRGVLTPSLSVWVRRCRRGPRATFDERAGDDDIGPSSFGPRRESCRPGSVRWRCGLMPSADRHAIGGRSRNEFGTKRGKASDIESHWV